MENLQELYRVVTEWSILPLALGLLLVLTVGTGLWQVKWRRTAWLLGLVLFGVTFYLGITRQEWGEVLFNGQLL